MTTLDLWPRRGQHWDVFTADVDGGLFLEVERIDEADETLAAWPDGPRFEFDDDAAGFVLGTASRPPIDCPNEVIEECRTAVRMIVKSWDDGVQP